MTLGRVSFLSLVRTKPPQRPSLYANSAVNSLLATPLTPSVPKYFTQLNLSLSRDSMFNDRFIPLFQCV